MKGISPIVTSVLLVLFTMLIAAVAVTWMIGFTQITTKVSQSVSSDKSSGFTMLQIVEGNESFVKEEAHKFRQQTKPTFDLLNISLIVAVLIGVTVLLDKIVDLSIKVKKALKAHKNRAL